MHFVAVVIIKESMSSKESLFRGTLRQGWMDIPLRMDRDWKTQCGLRWRGFRR